MSKHSGVGVRVYWLLGNWLNPVYGWEVEVQHAQFQPIGIYLVYRQPAVAAHRVETTSDWKAYGHAYPAGGIVQHLLGYQ